MKFSNIIILPTVATAVLSYSPAVEGIRSASGVSSVPSSDRTRRVLLTVRGGGNISNGASVSVVPEATLPRAISGGETGAGDADATPAASEDLAMKSAKWSGFRTRVLTAAGMIVSVGALASHFKEDGLAIFVVVVQAMMYNEMTCTIGGEDWGSMGATIRKYWWFITAAIAWNGPRVYPWKRMTMEAVAFGMTVSAGVVASVLGLQQRTSGTAEFREFIRQSAVSLLSAALVVLPSSFWIATLEEHGMKWLFAPAVFVAINDIMAYVCGKLLGKHKLLPSISPNKTWEGFLGAAVFTTAAAWVGLAEGSEPAILGPGLADVTRSDGLILAVFASLIAPFAGFLASVIKRAYGRKDFGDSLPGHGGFVDRLDCQLILAPFVYFYLSLYKFAATPKYD